MPIVAQLASDHVLDTAYEWLCRRRRDYSANSYVWAFRRDWGREKERIGRIERGFDFLGYHFRPRA
jgi:hypothetical protein